MKWVDGGHITSYEYNHNGIRTKKTTYNGSVVYDLVNGQAVGETRYDADGSVSLYIRYLFDASGSIVGIGLWDYDDTAWTDYYFVKNLQGDVLQVYRESDNALAASYTYDSWGNVLTASGPLSRTNPFRYRGYYYDTESEFYYLQSRYYDPAIGRFINADSYSSTGQGILGHNMFAYCGNNPVVRQDDEGSSWFLCFGIGIATRYVADVVENLLDGQTGLNIFKANSSVGEYIAAGVTAMIPGKGLGGAFVRNIVSEGIAVIEKKLQTRK